MNYNKINIYTDLDNPRKIMRLDELLEYRKLYGYFSHMYSVLIERIKYGDKPIRLARIDYRENYPPFVDEFGNYYEYFYLVD